MGGITLDDGQHIFIGAKGEWMPGGPGTKPRSLRGLKGKEQTNILIAKARSAHADKMEVEHAHALGVKHIEATAHCDRLDRDEQGRERWSGYYAWPRMGFDGPIPGTSLGRLRDSGLPAKIANAKNISEVMEHKAGRDWWRKNGDSIDVKFDLEHGSPYLRRLNSYLKETRPPDTMPAGGS